MDSIKDNERSTPNISPTILSHDQVDTRDPGTHTTIDVSGSDKDSEGGSVDGTAEDDQDLDVEVVNGEIGNAGDECDIARPNGSAKLCRLPASRIKSIMKVVPTVQLVNAEAVALIGKATEMFLGELSMEAHQMTIEAGKKTLTVAHIEGVIQALPQFEFLFGMLD